VELFQKFFERAQDKAGYTEDQRIYLEYQKKARTTWAHFSG
jgi:hypothetical protein